jgi:hypothetical protein
MNNKKCGMEVWLQQHMQKKPSIQVALKKKRYESIA